MSNPHLTSSPAKTINDQDAAHALGSSLPIKMASNSIAYLFSNNTPALHSILHDQNAARRVTPQQSFVGRETSNFELNFGAHNNATLAYCPSLHIGFDKPPKTGPGFILGTDESQCDIVLPHMDGISPRHCCLIFDKDRRLLLQDFSELGTSVTFDGDGGEVRSYFQWILNDPTMTGVSTIIVQIADIRYQIVVTPHAPSDVDFIERVDSFARDEKNLCHSSSSRLGHPSFDLIATPEGIYSPEPHSIYIKQMPISKSDLAVVYRVWDVSTGFHFAAKKLRVPAKHGWREEVAKFASLTSTQNENIVRFFAFIVDPEPLLIYEYLPLGDLSDIQSYEPLSRGEVISILLQALDALESLHKNNIVHREIRPDNILLQRREPIQIKLDLGLSHLLGDDLTTQRASPQYLAPEIGFLKDFVIQEVDFTMASDIWSLGVLIYGLVRPLPNFEPSTWYSTLIEEANRDCVDVFVEAIWGSMLQIDPCRRLTAELCLQYISECFASDL